MSEINDGGPAFPCSNEQFTHGNPQTGDAWPGLSLRDYFAGQALAGLSSTPSMRSIWDPADMARQSYNYADAMIKARTP